MKNIVRSKTELQKTKAGLKHKAEMFCTTAEYIFVRLSLLILLFYEVITLVDGKIHFLK